MTSKSNLASEAVAVRTAINRIEKRAYVLNDRELSSVAVCFENLLDVVIDLATAVDRLVDASDRPLLPESTLMPEYIEFAEKHLAKASAEEPLGFGPSQKDLCTWPCCACIERCPHRETLQGQGTEEVLK